MYCEFYQLTERPFNVTPDPKFLYLNARYREALASLNYGITQRKGFITLIGEAGTGKTTLLNKLLEDLDAKTKSVFIFNTNVTFEEILEYIFAEFDLPVHNGKKLYMLQRLNSFLLEELRGGGNVALLIDEAQDLEFSVLEDLRLLSNLETAKEKILQIVLSGQPELGQKLSNPVLRQLRQRIGINCRLLPLSRDEITEYIQYRLQAAGCPDLKLFSREAEEQIYHFSRGIPRLVNVVCDNALVIGYALGKKRLGADVITEAAADLLAMEAPTEELAERPVTMSAPSPTVKPKSRWRARIGVMGLVMVAVVVGLLSVGRTMLQKHTDGPGPAHANAKKFEVIRPGSQPQGSGVEVPVARSVDRVADEPDGSAAAQREDAARSTGSDPMPVAAAAAPPPAAEMLGGRVGHPDAAAERAPAAAESGPIAKAERPQDLAVGRRPLAGAGGEPVAPPVEPAPIARPVAREIAAVHRAPETAPQATESEKHAAPPAPIAKANPNVNDAAADLGKKAEARTAEEYLDAEQPDVVPAEHTARSEETTPRLDGVQFAQIAVRTGDSMSGIAMRKYGQASPTILDLLRLANPQLNDIDLIAVGQTVRLPELGEGFPILNDGSGHYALLVYSTPQGARATALQSALRGHGFDARVTTTNLGAQKPLFRVVVSSSGNRGEVEGTGRQLQRLFRDDTRLAQLGE